MTGPRPYRLRGQRKRFNPPLTTTRGPGAYAGMDDGKRDSQGNPAEIHEHWAQYWRLMDAGRPAAAMAYRVQHRDIMG